MRLPRSIKANKPHKVLEFPWRLMVSYAKLTQQSFHTPIQLQVVYGSSNPQFT